MDLLRRLLSWLTPNLCQFCGLAWSAEPDSADGPADPRAETCRCCGYAPPPSRFAQAGADRGQGQG